MNEHITYCMSRNIESDFNLAIWRSHKDRQIKLCHFILTGMTAVRNGIATVSIDGLQCEVINDIIAGGTLNGALVGPRSSHGTITSGPCPLSMPAPSVATPSMNGKEEIRMYMSDIA